MIKNLLTIYIYTFVMIFCSEKLLSQESIPFLYDGYINIDAQVDNKYQGNFIFDTGSPVLVLDSNFYKKVGLKFKSIDIEINGIGNLSRKAELVRDPINFEFSNTIYHFHSIFTTVFDLKSIVGKKIDGIFGVETFSHRPYMIDYISQNIVFTDSIKGYESTNAHFEGNNIYLILSLTLRSGKQAQGKFLIDTGTNRSTINSHLFKNEEIYNSTDKKKFYSKGGIGGNSNGFFLPVKTVNIGKFELQNLIMTVSTDSLGALSDRDFIGIIGNDLLDDFNIIFDHKKEKIWVKPNKNFNKNLKKLFKGISFLDTGEKWFVGAIVEDTDAFRKGIRMNDEILQINNILVEKIDLDTFTNKLNANDVLRLKIKRGTEEKDIEFKLNVFIKS